MNTVLFTGAGASKAIGYPLTNELLPLVRARLATDLFGQTTERDADAARKRKELRRYLTRLMAGIDDLEKEELPLITDIFSLVEYSILSGEALAIGEGEKLRRCRDLLKEAMTDVFLENFLRDYDLDIPSEKGEKQILEKLILWIRKRQKDLAIVTTNYDIGIEYKLWEEDGYAPDSLDLGFDWRDVEGDEYTRPRKPAFRMYKLHGSYNLLRCTTCGSVYFNPDGIIAQQAFREEIDDANSCVCRKDMRLDLQIVAPSIVRDVRDANLLSIWRSALAWMRTAERWIIVGYSLPPEDLAIRSLLLRAYATADRTPEITVVQNGDRAKPNYKLLFPKCDYQNDGLEKFLARE
jgi:NAD-dependent SIR2 family protein deacetylase